MHVEQHYLDCLSQASYLIADETTKRAVVVDPRRDVSPYLRTAEEHGFTIELVLETHFHADFLSGHLELAAATGAEIGYGDAAVTEFESRGFAHGERYRLGEVTLEIRHTPGHTPESISIVVYEHPDAAAPSAVLTGDTMFIGDVGRPDLLSSIGVTADELAGQLYDSLHDQLMTLPDETRVFPAHGAGSACGKHLSTATSSTIGEQRRDNYAVQPMSKDEFVAVVTDGQLAAPAYFAYDAMLNRASRPLLDEDAEPIAMSVADVGRWQRRGAAVIDTRDPSDFARGHLIGSINIGLTGRYAEFAGGVVQPGAPIVVVCEAGDARTAKNRLARIGFDHVVGCLPDPEAAFVAHPDDVARSSRLDVAAARRAMADTPDLQIIDVRGPGETNAGVIDGAIVAPLPQLNAILSSLDASKPTLVYCAGGYRSSIGASRLEAAGFTDVSDLLGGYGAWMAAVEAQPV
ncbi:MAG: MBL fold metallo-hydrolase [Actinomycetota bacterium]